MTTLHQIAHRVASRVVAMGRGYPAGKIRFQQVYWPVVRGFSQEPYREDAFGDFYVLGYESHDRLSPADVLFTINRELEGNTHKWSAEAFGKNLQGSWKDLKEVPKILASVTKKVQQEAQRRAEQAQMALLSLGGSAWESMYDDSDESVVFYVQETDASITVTFEDVPDVLSGGTGTYSIDYSEGADYEGHYGKQSQNGRWSSVQDASKVLKKAEGLWKTWNRG